jgi:pilus assembly protein CpaB
LVAGWVYSTLRAQETALTAARNSARGQTVDVVVASEVIPIGSRIRAPQLRTVPWPVEVQPDGIVPDAATATGRIARLTIQKNQPVLESYLTSESAGLLPLLITEGMRAMSVKVDKVTGVSGFVTPNSRVDVVVSGAVVSEEEGGQYSKVVLQNIKVLAIGQTIEMQDNKPVEVPAVTLLVSPEEAEKLTLAARQDPVRLALRGYGDERDVTTLGVSMRQLFGLDLRRDNSAGAKKPEPPPRRSIEIILDGHARGAGASVRSPLAREDAGAPSDPPDATSPQVPGLP